jgi:hypothetical protein
MRKITGITFSVILVVLAFGIAACGSTTKDEEEATPATTAISGGCSADFGTATVCTEYRGMYTAYESLLESQCVSTSNMEQTWSSDSCSTTGALGYCSVTGLDGQPDDATRRVYFYDSTDECADGGIAAGGTWVAM